MTPAEAILEASGLSLRRFAAITGCTMDRQVLAATKPETLARWLSALRDAGVDLELHAGLEVRPGGVTWHCQVTRV